VNYGKLQDHLFWGRHAPLSSLTGIALLILSSSRTAYALVTLGALAWHHTLLILMLNAAKSVFPRKGRDITVFCLSAMVNTIYLLFLFLLNPFLALEVYLYCLLVPVHAHSSQLVSRLEGKDTEDAILRAVTEALTTGVLIIALALIREPLGYGSLSLPGGSQGIVRLFVSRESPYYPIRLIVSSAGALLLLGYGVALFNRLKEIKSKTEQDSE
jgi:hypothetical protein